MGIYVCSTRLSQPRHGYIRQIFLSLVAQCPGRGKQWVEFLGLARNVFPLPEGIPAAGIPIADEVVFGHFQLQSIIGFDLDFEHLQSALCERTLNICMFQINRLQQLAIYIEYRIRWCNAQYSAIDYLSLTFQTNQPTAFVFVCAG